MGRFKCSSASCGKTFLVPAKIITEHKSLDFTASRTVVEKACCPFCEGLEFEEVS